MEKETLEKMEEHELDFNEARYKKQLVFSFTLLFIFAASYFLAAIITTKELKHVAAIDILGLPLAVYAGVAVFVVGVITVRLYLLKILKGWR